MVSNKEKLSLILSSLGLSSILPSVTNAGDPSSGDSDNDINLGTISQQMANAMSNSGHVPGSLDGAFTAGYDFSIDTDVGTVGFGVSPDPSTPFLSVWNGERYVHENDFLFGKPNTAFSTYAQGIHAYKEGIGGDTYLLGDSLKPDEEGNLKMQIREIEPEESFIDHFSIHALDLKENEHVIVDGNLEQAYLFDTDDVTHYTHSITHIINKTKTVKEGIASYTSILPQNIADITLEAEDELVLSIARDSLDRSRDLFLLVESHYRDWTLGDDVPFSFFEKTLIKTTATARNTVLAGSGLALAAAALLGAVLPDNFVSRFFGTTAHADVPIVNPPPPPPPPHCSWNGPGGMGEYENYQLCQNSNRPGNRNDRSLVVSAGTRASQSYLQTLFPRYVKASQEVVRIPKDIIDSATENIEIRIKATKRHKVRSALLFSATPKPLKTIPLTITKATHRRDKKDYATSLAEKNHSFPRHTASVAGFVHTIPGDVVDVEVKDVPRVEGTNRRYLLKANGFYTRMSLGTRYTIGSRWLSKLQKEDRALIRRLKIAAS